jgi:hypothetical protein
MQSRRMGSTSARGRERSGRATLVVRVVLSAVVLSAAGCRPPSPPLGTLSDPVWQNQEANAEPSEFVVHEHEFIVDTEFLNTYGEDHLKQIAYRMSTGQNAQVLVERSMNSARPETEYKYRVHPNPELDMKRRDVVVRALLAMKIPDADARTVVSPDLAPEYRAGENATTDYSDYGGGMGYGGGLGGAGGGGIGGGFGGVGGFASDAGSGPSGGPSGNGGTVTAGRSTGYQR